MIYRFGMCELDVARYELRRAGQLVAIEPKVFAVLLHLIEHRDRIVTKEELLAQCWPDTHVSESALTRCLTKVRKAVYPDRTIPSMVQTVHGKGYRFMATVEAPAITSPVVAAPLSSVSHDVSLFQAPGVTSTLSPSVAAAEVAPVASPLASEPRGHIAGLDRYRNGAGSARQEYRTLRGVNFVLGIMRIPLSRWPGHSLSVPVGLELYLKPNQAQALQVPYRSRSQLARGILDCVAEQVPGRPICSLADGGSATKDSLQRLPAMTHVVGRLPISAQLYQVPPKPIHRRRGAPRKQGALIGSPKTLAQTTKGWSPHPSEAGAAIQAWSGLWHAVLPGRLLRVVVVRRDAARCTQRQGQRKPPPAVEAFFTTDLTRSAQESLHAYRDRWAVEIAIRDANTFDGLGQDQCRKRQRIMGANTLRLAMAAARPLGFLDQVERGTDVPRCRYRPWYSQTGAPSQLDVVWVCRETLYAAGLFPIPRFPPVLAENREGPEHALPLAA